MNMNDASESLDAIQNPVTNKTNRRRRGPGKKERFWSKVDKNGPLPDQTKYPGLDQCWVWTGAVDRWGHGFTAYENPRKHTGAHRVSWIKCVGEIPAGLWVLHKCDNPPCVNPSHLFLGTRQDNVDDMVRKGRNRHGKGSQPNMAGELSSRSKLSTSAILEIRRRYLFGGVTQVQLGKEYGVHQGHITKIVRRLTWEHLP